MSEIKEHHSVGEQRIKTSQMQNESRPVYYLANKDLTRGGAVGWKFLNNDALKLGVTRVWHEPWPDGYLKLSRGPWRMPEYEETPKIMISRKLGRPPHDLEIRDGIWIISASTKSVLEAIDPCVCEFLQCETILPSGEPGRETWFCAINRAFVGGVDWEASENLDLAQHPHGGLRFSLNPMSKLKLRPEVIGDAPIFHIAESPSWYFCTKTFKDACKAAKLTGIRFEELSHRQR